MKRLILLLLILLLPLAWAAARDPLSDGDDKIGDTIRTIEEEEEKAEEGDDPWNEDEDSEDDGLGGFLFELFFRIFIHYAAAVRYAPYPYAESSDFIFSTLTYEPGVERKFICLQASSDFSVHFDQTYGNVNRLSSQLGAFHLNLYQQNIFSRNASLSFFSINGGLSILIRVLDLTAFVGAYKVTTTDTAMLSAGFAVRLFLPGKVYLDLYNLYGFLSDSAHFRHLIFSLNYSLSRFSIGAGYNFNYIVGDVYAGPCFKVSIWL